MQRSKVELEREDRADVDHGGFVDTPFDGPQPDSRVSRVSILERPSVLRARLLPSVMLIQIEPGQEPQELGLADLGVRVLRVKYPLPAAVRILVMRPLVIVIGPEVVERDLAFVFRAADIVGAATLQLGSVSRTALRGWLRREVAATTARRERSG